MTLVELLVVIAILGLLAVTVLPALSTTSDARRTREAARIVGSYIAKAQSRAIGRTEWAGFWLTPPNDSANFALDLYLADVPAAFCGDTIPTTIQGAANGAGAFILSSGSLTGITVTGSIFDLVRFDGQGPWYEYQSATSVGLRGSSSQTLINTSWPAPPPATHTFELLRQPIRAGSPLTLADGRCVDLYWSGYDRPTYDWFGSTGSPPGSIAILFDATSRLRQLFYGGIRSDITKPVYLLIGRSDRAGNLSATLSAADDSLGANWQYPDSYWIAIDPISGVTKTAECGPNYSNPFLSQGFIRSEIVAGGR